MGPKTALSLIDLEHALLPFGLRPRHVEFLNLGTVNSNYRVETDGGSLFVRVNEGKGEADVRYEGALLWHLGARDFPSPQPLRQRDGRPFIAFGTKWLTAFPWAPGAVVLEATVTPFHTTQVGEILSKFHDASADFAPARVGIYTFEAIVARLDGIRTRDELRPTIAELDAEVSYLRTHRPSAAELVQGTIHNDLFPDNVLWQDAQRLAAVLDLEQVSSGRLVYDLAVALLAWCWDGEGIDPGLARGLITGYERVRRLSSRERAALVLEARVAALRFTVTRITDVLLAGLARPAKDFHAYLRRLRWLQAAGERVVEDWFSFTN